MWAVVTDDDQLIRESDCLWPDLSPSVRIRELRYQDSRGQVGKIEDFDRYGFQRFSITPLDGSSIIGMGTQLIGIRGEQVMVVEINEGTGEVERKDMPLSDLTYNPELLRDGVRG